MSAFTPLAPPATTHALPTSASAIGDAYLEGKGHCDAGGPGCFLDPVTQRPRLITAVQMRVMNAADACYAALASVNLGEALRKDQDADMFTGLMVDMLSGVALGALTSAAKFIRGAGAKSVFTTEMSLHFPAATEVQAALDGARGADESNLGFALKAAVDAGKKSAKGAAGEDDEFARDKAASGDFLTQIGAGLAMSFQAMREGPPRDLNDGELIVMFHSLDASRQGMATFLTKINAKLAGFRSSSASKVGRTDRRIHEEKPADHMKRGDFSGAVHAAGEDRIRDTKLVLQSYNDGTDSDLMYYVRDYQPPMFGNQGTYDQTDDLSLYAEGGWKPSHRVDEEFRDAAIARNRTQWGEPYDVVIMSGRADGPAKLTEPKPKPIVATPPSVVDDATFSPVMVTE